MTLTPPPDGQSDSAACWLEAREIIIPESTPIRNTTIAAVELNINSRLGISPNLNIPPQGSTRRSLAANFRHALLFCFQDQNNLTSRTELFRRQNQNNNQIFLAIKDTLPYFLGAVREDALRLEDELKQAKRDLKILQRQLSEAEAIKGEGISTAVELVSQAVQAGILENVEDMPDELDVLVDLLRQATQWNSPEEPVESDLEEQDVENLNQLRLRKRELEEERRLKYDEIASVEAYAQEAEGYEVVAQQQVLRLESIGLYENLLRTNPHNSSSCPIVTVHPPPLKSGR